MNQNDMESNLRAVFADRAQQAPAGDDLAERIILQAGSGSVRQLRRPVRRRNWTLPLLAAAAVIAVVAGTVAVSTRHDSTAGHPVALLPTHITTAPSSPLSSATSSASEAPAAIFNGPEDLATTTNSSATAIALENFTVGDLTFVGDDIWALGTATCITSGTGLCTAFVHSADGKSWTTINSTPFNVPGDTTGCESRCVSHMRFASTKIGYVYGPDALLMTLDGGKSWQLESGGAVALETLDGNVIRVEQSAGCPPGCTFTVQKAPIGSTRWTTVPAPIAPMNGVGAQLSRNGSDAYLLLTANPAGGAGSATSQLLSSTDDGATWTNRGEPCPQLGGEVDSTALTTGGGDGSVIVACQPRTGGKGFAAVSAAGGRHFKAAATRTTPMGVTAVGGGSAHDLCVVAGQLYCSDNGGLTFTSTKGSHGGPGQVSFIGFESGTEGRALEIDGSAANGAVSNLWTTTDAGGSWSVGSIAAS
ncbi:hypothetical protein [Jatrophihabitans sp.]|uniref:hypothetical protein n=1 Tax=Jatrophihabitans sp. TaxID=1932789 RepID=UPI0030C6C932|nr:hypothetical protein [Jatrophihabitans sp.]